MPLPTPNVTKALYTREEVMQLTTFSRNTLYRRMEAGAFPASIQISARRVAWSKTAVDRWLEEQCAPQQRASDAGPRREIFNAEMGL